MPLQHLGPLNGFRIPELLLKASASTTITYKMSTSYALHTIQNPIFSNNLQVVDADCPQLLAALVLKGYVHDMTKISEIVDTITAEDPLDYNIPENKNLYRIKFKRLLRTLALGMQPDIPWDGELMSYPVHNQNIFDSYLLDNTYLEVSSKGINSDGFIYEVDGQQYLDLMFQIRCKP